MIGRRLGENMRSAEYVDIGLGAFMMLLISAMMLAFVF